MIVQIKQKECKLLGDRQRSYDVVSKRPLDFKLVIQVMLKPKWETRFAYRLELTSTVEQGSSTFHAIQSKVRVYLTSLWQFSCLMNDTLMLNSTFVDGTVEILDVEITKLRKSRIPIIKVRMELQ
ncbi:hypothetical protein Tco_0891628 [Tanacetum coccineum]|uniref:Uncharacterized protein n=1 Tax=Tanacetum coccineum TaxID=301880 RepID=A0ABQ5C6U7_9ASTR